MEENTEGKFSKPKNSDTFGRFSNPKVQTDQSLLEKAGSAAQKYINDPVEDIMHQANDISSGAFQGVANIAPGLANLGIHAVNGLTGNNTQPYKAFDFAPHNTNALAGEVASYLTPGMFAKIPEVASLASKSGKMIDSLLEHPSIAGKLNEAKNLIEKTPLVKQITNALGSKYAKGIGSSSLQGAIYNPENQATGAEVGGVLGALVPPVLKAGSAILHPYDTLGKIFRGSLSKEQLKHNLEIAQGTKTPLGSILQQPFLKSQQESVLSKVPLSGTNRDYIENANNITEKGEDILRDLLGSHNPYNVEEQLNKTVQDVAEKHTKLKQDLYNEADKEAEKIGLKLKLPNFTDAVQNYKSALNSTNILKTEPQLKSLLKRLGNLENPVKYKEERLGANALASSEAVHPSLKEANILSRHLADLSERFGKSTQASERGISNVLSDLSRILKNDIKSEIKETNHQPLIDKFSVAEKNYGKNFSPLLDKEIHNITSGKLDPDLIVQHFINTGSRTDRSNLMSKLTNQLPDSKKKLLAYAYLNSAREADKTLNPLALATLLNKKHLGPRQFDLLFPGETGKKIRSYQDLVNLNKEAFDVMRNPKTGARVGDFVPGAAVLSGFAHGGIKGALTAGALSVGTMGAARGFNKLLNSESVREKVVKAILRQTPKKNLTALERKTAQGYQK